MNQIEILSHRGNNEVFTENIPLTSVLIQVDHHIGSIFESYKALCPCVILGPPLSGL